MPKNIEKLIGSLENTTTKIEYIIDEYGESSDEIRSHLNEAIDALIFLNDELDSQMEEE